MEVMRDIRETHIKREQDLRRELEASYKTTIDNLEQEIVRQKHANKEANSKALMTINLQQEDINIMQKQQEIMKQEKEKHKHDIEEIIKENKRQEVVLQHKDEEISYHVQKEEQYNNKIEELKNQIKVLQEMEIEYEIAQEEDRKEIEDLTNALNSQTHNEKLLYHDLQEARKVIEKLKQETNQNSLEEQPEESSANGGSNKLENDREERTENNSLVWDHSHQSLLFGIESENCHSTPTIAGPLSNSDFGKESNQKHYENTNEITGLENTRNELQEEITTAKEANQNKMEMLLRNREELKQPEKYKDFDLK